jgi:uncharacterized protein (UPF0335 family)
MAQFFDPKADAAILNKAMKGLGTDEKALNSVFGYRTKEQLIEIAAEYKMLFQHTLEHDVKGDTSGNYETLLVWLQKPVVEVKCALLKYATKGAGTAERYLIDVLAPASNAEITAIFQADPTAITAVFNDCKHGDFSKTIERILKAKRDESDHVNEDEAIRVAEQLFKAGEGKLGTDEATFTEILTSRAVPFLKRVSYHYAAKHKHSLEIAIKKETSGHYEDLLIALTKSKYEYIADRFYHAVHGLGTDDHFLIYAFAILNKQELHHVAKLFHEKHNDLTLEKAVKGDVSGHYGELLKALLSGV